MTETQKFKRRLKDLPLRQRLISLTQLITSDKNRISDEQRNKYYSILQRLDNKQELNTLDIDFLNLMYRIVSIPDINTNFYSSVDN